MVMHWQTFEALTTAFCQRLEQLARIQSSTLDVAEHGYIGIVAAGVLLARSLDWASVCSFGL